VCVWEFAYMCKQIKAKAKYTEYANVSALNVCCHSSLGMRHFFLRFLF